MKKEWKLTIDEHGNKRIEYHRIWGSISHHILITKEDYKKITKLFEMLNRDEVDQK